MGKRYKFKTVTLQQKYRNRHYNRHMKLYHVHKTLDHRKQRQHVDIPNRNGIVNKFSKTRRQNYHKYA